MKRKIQAYDLITQKVVYEFTSKLPARDALERQAIKIMKTVFGDDLTDPYKFWDGLKRQSIKFRKTQLESADCGAVQMLERSGLYLCQ